MQSFQTIYAIVLFARSLRLVTAESTRGRQGQVILDIHDVFTWFVRLQKTDQETTERSIAENTRGAHSVKAFILVLIRFFKRYSDILIIESGESTVQLYV